MRDRQKAILEALTQSRRLEVTALAQALDVSSVTIRKDLEALEKRGLIKREHGYAILGPSDDLGTRLAYQYEDKHRIARLAAASVSPGETVMIESGSCCALLAEVLVKSRRDVKIITNSAFIAGYVRGELGAKVVLLGGDYQLESQVMVGPLVPLCAERFFVDKLFIGTDGITAQAVFTSSDMMRAEAVKAMSGQAEKTIILTQAQKFSLHGVVPLIDARDVYAVYTDEGIPREAEQSLLERGVLVYKA